MLRAWALRTIAGIRLHVVAPFVLFVVGKCARDPFIYVRKFAVNALPKLHDLRLEEHIVAIKELRSTDVCLSLLLLFLFMTFFQ